MNILDRRFKYVPAAKTDVRKTFARARAEQKAKADKEAAEIRAREELDARNAAEAAAKTTKLKTRTA